MPSFTPRRTRSVRRWRSDRRFSHRATLVLRGARLNLRGGSIGARCSHDLFKKRVLYRPCHVAGPSGKSRRRMMEQVVACSALPARPRPARTAAARASARRAARVFIAPSKATHRPLPAIPRASHTQPQHARMIMRLSWPLWPHLRSSSEGAMSHTNASPERARFIRSRPPLLTHDCPCAESGAHGTCDWSAGDGTVHAAGRVAWARA